MGTEDRRARAQGVKFEGAGKCLEPAGLGWGFSAQVGVFAIGLGEGHAPLS